MSSQEKRHSMVQELGSSSRPHSPPIVVHLVYSIKQSSRKEDNFIVEAKPSKTYVVIKILLFFFHSTFNGSLWDTWENWDWVVHRVLPFPCSLIHCYPWRFLIHLRLNESKGSLVFQPRWVNRIDYYPSTKLFLSLERRNSLKVL